MGICLDTEQGQAAGGGNADHRRRTAATWGQEQAADFRYANTPPDGHLPMHNGGHVHFEAPRVPVIFVLGGPGSGKVTHCDNLMQEKKGIIHINMTDLLQQYAIGNAGYAMHNSVIKLSQDMQDFSQLSSRTVTEVLMLEMKMAPSAKTYLVSGYPRSMRDVVEYSEKIQVVNGVILISWRQKVLERQIDYGAKLGQVVLSLARMELNNFFKNVMPVADYFDQSNMLIAVNGERHPGDVYKDFRAAVMRILGEQDNPPVFANGKIANVPADVSTEQVPVRAEPPTRPAADVITVTARELQHNYSSPVKQGWPRFVWVIGGPGSNKAALCSQALAQHPPGWAHVSVGRLLRVAAAAEGGAAAGLDAATIRQCIVDGELAPLNLVMQLVESHAAAHMSAAGVLLDGFPRSMQQAAEFESKFKQQPALILLDCSKLQLGRGRLDDSVSAFRRRLEIFREHSLPMLKAMDNVGRLTIVDGDTDSAPVQEDFKNVIAQHIRLLAENQANGTRAPAVRVANGHATNGYARGGGPGTTTATLHDLEAAAELDTVSKRVHAKLGNGVTTTVNGHVPHAVPVGNGFATERRGPVRAAFAAAAVPVHSHI